MRAMRSDVLFRKRCASTRRRSARAACAARSAGLIRPARASAGAPAPDPSPRRPPRIRPHAPGTPPNRRATCDDAADARPAVLSEYGPWAGEGWGPAFPSVSALPCVVHVATRYEKTAVLPRLLLGTLGFVRRVRATPDRETTAESVKAQGYPGSPREILSSCARCTSPED